MSIPAAGMMLIRVGYGVCGRSWGQAPTLLKLNRVQRILGGPWRYSTPSGSRPPSPRDPRLSASPRVAQLCRDLDALSPTDRRLLVQHLQSNLPDDSPPSSAPPSVSGVSEPPRVPPFRTILVYSVHQALPFVGFGFLDNLIMILAGEYIDHTLGVTLSISTMAAAGLGNAISDAFGVGSAWYVEHWIVRFGFHHPHLSLEERALTRVRMGANIGKALGVTVGCLIGMLPLAFM